MWLSGSYGSKTKPVGPLDAEKVAEAALLHVVYNGIPNFPLTMEEWTLDQSYNIHYIQYI